MYKSKQQPVLEWTVDSVKGDKAFINLKVFKLDKTNSYLNENKLWYRSCEKKSDQQSQC